VERRCSSVVSSDLPEDWASLGTHVSSFAVEDLEALREI
jgi:hypothetical protein